MKKVSRKTAQHYIWKDVRDGWHFVQTDALSVIAEKMPPRTQEDMHFHRKSKQFFYMLSGEATMCFPDCEVVLCSGDGIEIEPEEAYQMCNNSENNIEFIVVSMPKSHGDRVLV